MNVLPFIKLSPVNVVLKYCIINQINAALMSISDFFIKYYHP